MLTIVTTASLLLAFVMSGVVWRLKREDRRRSRARVAALASDLADFELQSSGPATAGLDLFRQEKTGAGLDLFRQEKATAGADLFQQEKATAGADLFQQEEATAGADLFRQKERRRPETRFAVVLTIGAFAVATALALIVVMSRTGPLMSESELVSASGRPVDAAPTAAVTATSGAQNLSAAPLELIALSHQREGDGIVVRGVVRNPASGSGQGAVTAVVFVFTRDGAFLASARAAVSTPALEAGAESTFVVSVPHANDVGRYRVSFRSGDRVVPHVDRREREPVAQLR
jgi:hypothetical protein